MIRIDFLLAISIYLSTLILFLLGEWILDNKDSKIKDILQDTKFILQCPICSFIYHDYKNGAISICPRCNSYTEREGAKL